MSVVCWTFKCVIVLLNWLYAYNDLSIFI